MLIFWAFKWYRRCFECRHQ